MPDGSSGENMKRSSSGNVDDGNEGEGAKQKQRRIESGSDEDNKGKYCMIYSSMLLPLSEHLVTTNCHQEECYGNDG